MKPYSEYTPEEIAAFRRGELEALGAWYTDNDFAESMRLIWSDSCEGFCPCLDSDYPRNLVIADATRAAHIAAFGAIRRAAEVARKAERDHASFYAESKRDLDDFGPGVERVFADGCRAAIRAAIGSPKA